MENSYKTPIHGVSTLAPRNRAEGHAGVQVNMRSDPVAKLTRRPSLKWNYLMEELTTATIVYHEYYRAGKQVEFLIDDAGTLTAFIDGEKTTVYGELGTYGQSTNLALETINDTTYVVNRDVTVELDTDTDEVSIEDRNFSHINIVSAVSYSTTLTIELQSLEGTSLATATFVAGNGVNTPGDDDTARATNAVATSLGEQLAAVDTLEVEVKGSCISVKRSDTTERLIAEISEGRDSTAIAINGVTESIAGLPLYAKPGTRITVKPDPLDTSGQYYLEAVGLQEEVDGDMIEVVWAETRSPFEPYAFVGETMPHTLVYDEAVNSFTVGPANWVERGAGDNDSVPVPTFVGKTISALGQFQKRLALTSDSYVSMTRTEDTANVNDNLLDWWKVSATNLLVSDPIEIKSNSTGIDVLQYLVEHNRDLLILASNGQFKIDGTAGITPQTAAMPLTTTLEIQVTVPPVPVGSAVYLPITYGESTGITKYSGTRNEQDTGQPITHHVVGYMAGEAQIFVGSSNLEMLALKTTGAPDNHIFIYEQFIENGETLQQSWSTWELPEDDVVIAMYFRHGVLNVIVRVDYNIVHKSYEMYSQVAQTASGVYLDDFVELPTDGLTATLPDGYTGQDFVLVMGEGTIYPLERVPFSQAGSTLTFSEDIGEGVVYAGTKFVSTYRPTRPFVYDSKGVAVTTDKIRVSKYILNVVDTSSVWMHIDSPYYSDEDQEVTARTLGNESNLVGVAPVYSGDMQFSYGQNADYAEAEFYTTSFLGMTIAGISWAGQYKRTSERMS